MAPSSVWFTKQLPIHKWVELCNKKVNDTAIYLLGAADDSQICEDIKIKSILT